MVPRKSCCCLSLPHLTGNWTHINDALLHSGNVGNAKTPGCSSSLTVVGPSHKDQDTGWRKWVELLLQPPSALKKKKVWFYENTLKRPEHISSSSRLCTVQVHGAKTMPPLPWACCVNIVFCCITLNKPCKNLYRGTKIPPPDKIWRPLKKWLWLQLICSNKKVQPADGAYSQPGRRL